MEIRKSCNKKFKNLIIPSTLPYKTFKKKQKMLRNNILRGYWELKNTKFSYYSSRKSTEKFCGFKIIHFCHNYEFWIISRARSNILILLGKNFFGLKSFTVLFNLITLQSFWNKQKWFNQSENLWFEVNKFLVDFFFFRKRWKNCLLRSSSL